MPFNKLLRQIAGLVLAVCAAADVFAQAAYPAKPVKIVVPYSTGGPAEIYARFIGDRLPKTLAEQLCRPPSGGSPFGTGERPEGAHRARQIQTGRSQLRVLRTGHAVSHGGRAFQGDGRN